ncbi:MAG: GldG family protein [Treponema sp.]|nr:GldG family protein [Treponema sp.]
MNRNQARVIGILSIAAFVLAFLLNGRLWFRLDLTRNKTNTISEVSRNLYREIPDRVTITYFVSDRLALAHPLPGEIAGLLREYAAYSRGKIRFIQKDPARANLPGKVEELGIAPQQIQVVEKNESTLATVYSGILIEYLDRESVIPVVFSLDTLEYDLSSRIRSLVRNTERELGVIVADSYKQWSTEYALLNRELVLSGFKVRLIQSGDEIPGTLPALFVLGGAEDLDEHTLPLIDRYITGGGKVLFALDGIFVNTQGSLEARAVRDKGLLAMLAHYGVVVRPALVLDKTALTLTFQTRNGNSTVIRSVKYPEWIGIPQGAGNPGQSLAANFGGLDLYWASPLELSPPPGVTAEVLFSSTSGAWLQTENFITDPNMISRFEDEADKTRGTKILGAALSGVFPRAYEDTPKASGGSTGSAGTNAPGESQGLPLQKKASRIIVVGDSDFAGPLMQVSRGEGRNLEFLIRAAEWLSSDDDIIAIRSRGGEGRLDRITDIEKRNRAMAFSRGINTVVVPLGVIIAGLFLVWRRPKGRNKGE